MKPLLLLSLLHLAIPAEVPRASMMWESDAERSERYGQRDCYFACMDSAATCVRVEHIHNGRPDCPDASDEYCLATQFKCGAFCTAAEADCRVKAKTKMCSTGLDVIRCETWDECVLSSWAMNGEINCIDGSDEDCEYLQRIGRLPSAMDCAKAGNPATGASQSSETTLAVSTNSAAADNSSWTEASSPTEAANATQAPPSETPNPSSEGGLSADPDGFVTSVNGPSMDQINACRAPLIAEAKAKFGDSHYCNEIADPVVDRKSAKLRLSAVSICGEEFDSATFMRDDLGNPDATRAKDTALLLLHYVSTMFQTGSGSDPVYVPSCIPKHKMIVGSIRFPISVACKPAPFGDADCDNIVSFTENLLTENADAGDIRFDGTVDVMNACTDGLHDCAAAPAGVCMQNFAVFSCSCNVGFVDQSPNLPGRVCVSSADATTTTGSTSTTKTGSSTSTSTSTTTTPTASTSTTAASTTTTQGPSSSPSSLTPSVATTTAAATIPPPPRTTAAPAPPQPAATTAGALNDAVGTAGLSTTLLIVIILAAIAALLLLLCCCWWWCCRKRTGDEAVEPLAPSNGRQAWSAESAEPELQFRAGSGGSIKPSGPAIDSPIRDTPTMWETYTGRAAVPPHIFQEQGRVSSEKGGRAPAPMVALNPRRSSVQRVSIHNEPSSSSGPSFELSSPSMAGDEEDEAYERWKRHMAAPKSPNPSRYDTGFYPQMALEGDPHTPSPPFGGGPGAYEAASLHSRKRIARY